MQNIRLYKIQILQKLIFFKKNLLFVLSCVLHPI